jgi:hypothetical protein
MATTASGRIIVRIDIAEQKSNDLGTSTQNHAWYAGTSASGEMARANGSSASQIQLVYSDSFSVAAGAPITYDLAGSLTAMDGTTLTFTKVLGMAIKHSTGSGTLQIGAGSNPLLNWVIATGDGVQIGPLGTFLIDSPSNGYTVTAATGDTLTLTSSSGTITGDLIIWGWS